MNLNLVSSFTFARNRGAMKTGQTNGDVKKGEGRVMMAWQGELDFPRMWCIRSDRRWRLPHLSTFQRKLLLLPACQGANITSSQLSLPIVGLWMSYTQAVAKTSGKLTLDISTTKSVEMEQKSPGSRFFTVKSLYKRRLLIFSPRLFP